MYYAGVDALKVVRNECQHQVRVRPTWPVYLPTSPLVESLVGGPLWRFCMHWRCSKSVACSGELFDPCEVEQRVLIGR
jgi:hypothetical protein